MSRETQIRIEGVEPGLSDGAAGLFDNEKDSLSDAIGALPDIVPSGDKIIVGPKGARPTKRGRIKGKKRVCAMMGIFKKSVCMRGKSKRPISKAIFGSGVAAISLSISSDGVNNRNRILLNEAQAVENIEKTLGIGLGGVEGEVVSKIAQMEEIDEVLSRNKFLNEAKAVWDFQKTMGIGYDGDEGEVISEIAKMEEIDKARYRAMLAEEEKKEGS